MELTRHFETLTDFRVKGRCLHELVDILVLILIGTLCDCDDFVEIRDFGEDKVDFLRDTLGLKLVNGIPSEDTLERVMKYLNPKELELSIRACASEILSDLKGKQVCVDGKEHRGTIPLGEKHAIIRTVSVWLSEEQLCFGQSQIASKSSEKTAIPLLLEALDIQGSIITIDAIACQENIVKTIVTGKADYLIALKKNQGILFEQVHDWMISRQTQLPYFQAIGKEHGRIEQRRVFIYQDFEFLEACHCWEKLNTLIMVESTRITSQKTSIEHRFYISSVDDKDPETYYKLTRNHWSIENHLHWQLDLTFKEDKSRIKKANAPLNMNIVRKLALYLLSKNKEKISFKRKRKKAARDNEFLINILQNI